MPWKVILFLVVLVVALLFIGFNLGNRSNISVGFHEWKDVPVFLSMFFSFAFGILAMIPFLLRLRFSRKRKKPKEAKGEEHPPGEQPPPDAKRS
jgi:uncharacterized integral membrane protein